MYPPPKYEKEKMEVCACVDTNSYVVLCIMTISIGTPSGVPKIYDFNH